MDIALEFINGMLPKFRSEMQGVLKIIGCRSLFFICRP